MAPNDISLPETARDALVTALSAITGLQAVYGYLVKDLSGQSPIVMVERISWFPQFAAASVVEPMQFAIWLWVERSDAAAAEDLLDSLSQDIAQVIQTWENAEYFQPNELLYADADNASGQYRVEIHYIEVDWE